MDDPLDICDRRGRLRRLAIACSVGAGVTIGLLYLIRTNARDPNPDAISQALPFLLGIAMFVVVSWLALQTLEKLRRPKGS